MRRIKILLTLATFVFATGFVLAQKTDYGKVNEQLRKETPVKIIQHRYLKGDPIIDEGFEGDWPPVDWTNSGWEHSLYGGPHTGAEWAYSNLQGATLATPAISVTAGLELKFWYRAESASYPQDFDVVVTTDTTDLSNVVFQETGYDVVEYAQATVNLTDYDGQDVYIVFVGQYGTGGWDYGLCIDDVVVKSPPAGPAIDVFPGSLMYPTLEAGTTASDSVYIANYGTADLEITAVTGLTAEFTTDFTGTMTIAPGDTIDVPVAFTFAPADAGIFEATAVFESNAVEGYDTLALSGSAYAAGLMFEGFENEMFPPEFWDMTDGWIRNTSASYVYDGEASARVSGDNTSWLFTPKLEINEGDVFSFYYRVENESYPSGLKLWLAPPGKSQGDTSSYTVELLNLDVTSSEWNLASYTFDGTYDGQEVFLAFQRSWQTVTYYWAYIDNVMGPGIFFPDNDLAALDVTGSGAPTLGTEANYTVTVRNFGNNTQTDYTVKLMGEGDVELGSVAGTEITSQEVLTFDFTHTFTTEGSTYVYGKVELTGDEDASNDMTADFSVDVQPVGTVTVLVGDDDSTSYNMPANFYYKSSLTQTIYYPDEINMGGTLKGVDYYNNFETDLTATPLKIWAGETEMEDLSDGWIPATDLTLVFDGAVDVPSGENTIHIGFDTEFLYTGGKLVLMVERPLDSVYYSSSDVFYVTGTPEHPNRTLSYRSDATPADPNAPEGGNIYSAVPNTNLFFDVTGMGSIGGTVYDESAAPMDSAMITVGGTYLAAYSAEDGTYSFPYVFEGDYEVHATKFGYNDAMQNVTVVEYQTATADFNMELRPQVTVSGHVEKSDNVGTGLENAYVMIEGYAMYADSTDANGDFAFADVWGNAGYTIMITADGCEPYEAEFEVVDAAVDLGTVVLTEIPYPPVGVLAEVNDNDEGEVTWFPPGSGFDAQYVYDDGTAENGWTINAGYESWLGNKFDVTDVGYITGLEIWGQDNTGAGTEELTVDFFDSEFNYLGTSEPFIMPSEAWVEVVVDDIAYSGVFYAMVHWNNLTGSTHFMGFDEDGEYATANYDMYTDGTDWMTIHEAAGSAPGVFLMRANVFTSGSIAKASPSNAVVNTGVDLSEVASASDQFSDTYNYAKTTYNIIPESKAFESYDIYRFLAGEEEEMGSWVELATEQADTFYTDAGLVSVDDGVYRYAVIANYTNDVESDPALSNLLPVGMEAQVTINITTNSGDDAEGAEVMLMNTDSLEEHTYTAVAPAGGVVVFDLVWKGTYIMEVMLPGFEGYYSTDVEITADTETFDIELVELLLSPGTLSVEHTGSSTILHWGGGAGMTEDFEAGVLPEDWATSGVNADVSGPVPGYWTVNDYVSTDFVPFDTYHVGTWWSYDHQDEWLMTPEFSVGGATDLTFWTVVYEGSTNADHYYVKVSTDGGSTWDEVWDASALTGNAWNYYAYPYTIDLSAYAGQDVKVAFNAVDGPTNDGLWYIWFLDNITIGSKSGKYTFSADEIEHVSHSNSIVNYNSELPVARDGNTAAIANPKADKALVQYLVYLDDMETPLDYTTETSYEFTELVEGDTYMAGVVAEYTTGFSEMSNLEFTVPAFYDLTLNITSNAGSAEGADVTVIGDEFEFMDVVPESGTILLEGLEGGTYTVTVSLEGFESYEETITLDADVTEDIELIEIIIPPFGLSVEVIENTAVLTWNVSDEIFYEDFETGALADNWATEAACSDVSGPVPGYWTVSDYISEDFVPYDTYHVGLWWSYDHQDEWLITPEFTAGGNTQLTFSTVVYEGSENADHYYVKVSTDGGSSWEEVWDASDLTGDAWNYYASPYSIDLSSYSGQDIKVAFNAVDGPTNDGLWYIWFIDNIEVGSGSDKIRFTADQIEHVSKGTKSNNAGVSRSIARDGKVKAIDFDAIAPGGNKEWEGYNVYLTDMVTPYGQTTVANHTITELAWETEYTVGITSVYTSGESQMITTTFTTGDTPIDVNEVALDSDFTVYPNPANNMLYIGTDKQIDRVDVYNAVGKLVMSEENYTDGVNVNDLEEGIYILQIASGNNLVTKRISITE